LGGGATPAPDIGDPGPAAEKPHPSAGLTGDGGLLRARLPLALAWRAPGPTPMSALPATHPTVLVALQHARLRDAIATELGCSSYMSVIGQAGDLDAAVRGAREHHADGIVVGTDLLRGDLVASLRKLVAALPSTRVVVVGTESSTAYARALEAAGAAAYVSLQSGADVLSTSVQLALRREGH
jgi:response regulator RpfG family c-di-GMP phosphodiesterase